MYKNKHLSVSRLRRFEQCPHSFELHYVRELPAQATVPLQFGTLLHTVLERLYRWIIDTQYTGPIPVDLMRELYRDAWVVSGLSHYANFAEGLQILMQFAQRHYSVDHRRIVAIEHNFSLSIGRFKVVGLLDHVERIDEETIEIIDYKSNRRISSQEEVDEDFQLSVYALAAREIWPWAKRIRLGLELLRHGMRQMTERSDEALDAARAYILAAGDQSERLKEYPAKIGPLCSWCDQSHHCQAFQRVSGEAVPKTPKPASEDEWEAMARERDQVASRYGILYRRREAIDKLLKAKIEAEGEVTLAGKQYRIGTQTTATKYPTAPTVQAFVELAGMGADEVRDKILSVDRAKADEMVDELKEKLPRSKYLLLRAHIEAYAEKRFATRLFSKKV